MISVALEDRAERRHVMLSAVAALSSVLVLALAVVFWMSWRNRRCAAQKLAAALIGEIAAVIESIDVRQLVLALDHDLAEPSAEVALRKFSLPRFTIYEATAAKLDRLGVPLQRQISFLFDRWAALPCEVAALGEQGQHITEERRTFIERVRDEMNQSLKLADDVLLALRSIASPLSQEKHLN
jgi:hypothetical protein